LYEAAVGIVLALVLFLHWKRRQSGLLHGSLFGLYLVAIFASRFVLEYFKESVTPIETGCPVSIGQLLSIPFVLAGLWLLLTRKGPLLSRHATRSNQI
jgi:prolipoprotein diacylglyceryltransferase